jgi:hypothetical protein
MLVATHNRRIYHSKKSKGTEKHCFYTWIQFYRVKGKTIKFQQDTVPNSCILHPQPRTTIFLLLRSIDHWHLQSDGLPFIGRRLARIHTSSSMSFVPSVEVKTVGFTATWKAISVNIGKMSRGDGRQSCYFGTRYMQRSTAMSHN